MSIPQVLYMTLFVLSESLRTTKRFIANPYDEFLSPFFVSKFKLYQRTQRKKKDIYLRYLVDMLGKTYCIVYVLYKTHLDGWTDLIC